MSHAAQELVDLIETLLRGHTDRHDEAEILRLLGEADDITLDAAVLALDLPALLGDVDDRLLGPKNLSALLDMLAGTRVDALSVAARARLVGALQRGRTGSRDERAIRDVFLATRGEALTALKNAVDSGRDHRDLQQLVFGDIDDKSVRSAILTHFAEQATGLPRDRKVLSDIDDTLYANWKDQRYPKKTVYPGVRQLYLELDRGHDGLGRLGDVAFVTARPKDRPGIVERLTHGSLAERGVEDATVLAGSLLHVLSNDSIAEKKLANFVEYAMLFPEYDFVFVGDSGQGDIAFGRAMREREPQRVQAILIHDVVGTPEAERAARREEGIVLFDTYAGAAAACHVLGLITREGLERVIAAAKRELAAIPFSLEEQRAARMAELARDLERARHGWPA